MGYVIADLSVDDIDRLECLWRELLDHHLDAAPHLAALGAARDPADSWRVRRAQWGAQVMTISVIAGNEGAVRFYRREGASDYLHTLVMPVREG